MNPYKTTQNFILTEVSKSLSSIGRYIFLICIFWIYVIGIHIALIWKINQSWLIFGEAVISDYFAYEMVLSGLTIFGIFCFMATWCYVYQKMDMRIVLGILVVALIFLLFLFWRFYYTILLYWNELVLQFLIWLNSIYDL